MPEAAKPESLLPTAAWLIRTTKRGSLATRLDEKGQPGVVPGMPYVSLVLLAPDESGAPFLLLSDLSEHAKNLKADPALALLLEQTAGKKDPLAEPRLTLLGEAQVVEEAGSVSALKEAFVAGHPAAKVWAGFADFRPYRLTWSAAHFVAGFGRIAWLPLDDLRAELSKPV